VTALADSPVFWIGLLAGLGVLSVLPAVIAVFRRVENIAVLERLPVAWPAALVVALRDAGKG
jgi:uncharacterized membrane protein YesL